MIRKKKNNKARKLTDEKQKRGRKNGLYGLFEDETIRPSLVISKIKIIGKNKGDVLNTLFRKRERNMVTNIII